MFFISNDLKSIKTFDDVAKKLEIQFEKHFLW